MTSLSARLALLFFLAIGFAGLSASDVPFQRNWTFQGLESWGVNGGTIDSGTMQLSDQTPGTTTLRERATNWHMTGKLQTIRLAYGDLEVNPGASLKIAPQVTVNGKQQWLQVQPLTAGDNELVWTVQHPETRFEHWIVLSTGVTAATVNIRQMSLTGHADVRDLVYFDIETGHPLRLLPASGKAHANITIGSYATSPEPYTGIITLTDFQGNTTSSTCSGTLGGDEKITVAVDVPEVMGIHWVELKATSKAGETAVCKHSLMRMIPHEINRTSSKPFHFGICTHTGRWSRPHWDLEARLMAEMGADVVRTNREWGNLQPAPGVWKWEKQDAVLEVLEAHGLEAQFLLGFCPQWAAPVEKRSTGNWLDWSRSAPDLTAWVTYIRAITERYRGRVHLWEIWNEPDIGFFKGTFEEYLAMMKVAYPIIKETDPDNYVMTGGFATLMPHPGRKDPNFHAKAIAQGQDYFDYHAMHQHGTFPTFQVTVDGALQDVRKTLRTDKPLFFNETGLASVQGGEHRQAEALVKKLTFCWSRNGIGYFWYDLRNDGYDAKDHEHTYGMMTTDYYPKAVYPTYANLTRQLKGASYVSQLQIAEGIWAFVFATAEGHCLTWWGEPGVGSQDILLQTNASSAVAIDIMGNEKELPLRNGSLTAQVTEVPAYVKLIGSTHAPVAGGRLIRLASHPYAMPEEPLEVKLIVANPFDSAQEVAVSLGSLHQTAQVPAHGEATAAFALEAAQISDTLTATAHFPATDIHASLEVPVTRVRLVANGSGENPDFSIPDTDGAVIDLAAADPNSQHLLWQGTQDLSARAWIWHADGTLRIRILATDDYHVQNEQASTIWRADSVQMGLTAPGMKGYWELGFALGNGGQPLITSWASPLGRADLPASVQANVTRQGTTTNYDLTIPLADLGFVPDQDGILKLDFSFLINESDRGSREGWIELTQGIGQGKDPSLFMPLVIRTRP